MRTFLVGTIFAAALVAAGCGGSGGTSTSNGNGEASKSANQVIADALKATNGARSFNMSGTVSSTHGPVGLDFLVAKGKGATGSVTLGGAKIRVILIGHDGYLKTDTAGWTQLAGQTGPMIAQRLHGRWLGFPVDDPLFQPILDDTRPKALFAQLQSANSALANSGTTTYKGKSVVKLHDEVKNGTLYVAATGTPYPVALLGSGGGTVVFGDWNTPVSLIAPKDAVDFAHLNS